MHVLGAFARSRARGSKQPPTHLQEAAFFFYWGLLKDWARFLLGPFRAHMELECANLSPGPPKPIETRATRRLLRRRRRRAHTRGRRARPGCWRLHGPEGMLSSTSPSFPSSFGGGGNLDHRVPRGPPRRRRLHLARLGSLLLSEDQPTCRVAPAAVAQGFAG